MDRSLSPTKSPQLEQIYLQTSSPPFQNSGFTATLTKDLPTVCLYLFLVCAGISVAEVSVSVLYEYGYMFVQFTSAYHFSKEL